MNYVFGEILSDREIHERELAERQRRHLENVFRQNDNSWRPCMHDQCTQCHGTGVKYDGSPCIHYLSCPCPKCTPSF